MRIRIAILCVVVALLGAGDVSPDPDLVVATEPAPAPPPAIVNPYFLQANSIQQLTVQPLPDGRLLLRGSIGHKTFADWGTTISQFAQIYKVYGGKIVPDGEYFLRQAEGDFALPGHVWTRSR